MSTSLGLLTHGSFGTPMDFRKSEIGFLRSSRMDFLIQRDQRSWIPLLQSTNWLTVPLGLLQVVAAEGLIPSFAAHSLFTVTVYSRSSSSRASSSGPGVERRGTSLIPVRLTPRRRSSSAFFCQILRRYLKLVRVDCSVPRMAARRIFRLSEAFVSPGRQTTSVRLQNPCGRRMISPQGLVPKSMSSHLRRPYFLAWFRAAMRLKNPRSPERESYRAR